MWFTLLIIIDLAVAYWFISWVIALRLLPGVPDLAYWVAIPLAYYCGPRLPEWPRFRRFRFWGWARRVYFHGTQVPLRAPHHHHGQVLYVAWPHGVYAETISAVLLTSDEFADVLPVCSSVLFAIPLLRELASLMGAVHANAADMRAALEAGRSLIILPEGMRGAIEAPPRLLLEKRTGYIAVAKSARCPGPPLQLVTLQVHYAEPMYHVGSHGWFQRWMLSSWLRYPWPLIHWGQWYTFLPRRQRVTFLLGKRAIPVTEESSVEEIHAALLQQVV